MRRSRLLRFGLVASAVLLGCPVVFATAASATVSLLVPCGAGQNGLRAAVNAANAAGRGSITLASGCTYTLTVVDNGENGLPVVTGRVSVNGNGSTISGSDALRVFEVDGPSGNLSLQNVTLTHGSAGDFGGAIANFGGAVTLNGSVVTDSTAVTAGGGIVTGVFGPGPVGRLTLNNSVVTGNSSPGHRKFRRCRWRHREQPRRRHTQQQPGQPQLRRRPARWRHRNREPRRCAQSHRVVDAQQQPGERQHRAQRGWWRHPKPQRRRDHQQQSGRTETRR